MGRLVLVCSSSCAAFPSFPCGPRTFPTSSRCSILPGSRAKRGGLPLFTELPRRRIFSESGFPAYPVLENSDGIERARAVKDPGSHIRVVVAYKNVGARSGHWWRDV